MTKYKGTWYQLMVTKNQPFGGANSDCVRAIYSDNEKANRVTVTNTGLSGAQPMQELTGIKGYAEQAPNGSGNFSLNFPYVPWSGKYKVVHTDYNSYSIVYSCMNVLGVYHTESIYVLTRDALVKESDQWKMKVHDVLKKIREKFTYDGGSGIYWIKEWYTFTVQGEANCDYSLKLKEK